MKSRLVATAYLHSGDGKPRPIDEAFSQNVSKRLQQIVREPALTLLSASPFDCSMLFFELSYPHNNAHNPHWQVTF